MNALRELVKLNSWTIIPY